MNKLGQETSPYLLQHAHNPVNWYPWGKEALEKAKRENKPIFLSIGYAACHWCHVMERESFENKAIAESLNTHFVSIKVDREERPDLDDIYMAAVIAVSGSGGWPMTVFLTPDLKPFFAGTYFPPEDKWGRMGFKKIVSIIGEKWHEQQGQKRLLHDADTIKNIIAERTSQTPAEDPLSKLSPHLLDTAVNQLKTSFDPKWGGFSVAPKFPPANAISLLLRHYFHTGDKYSLSMATFTLDKMARGGMYDHVGGGFHRYSTDEKWLVPHFEKMLYDNALLATVYLEAFQVTKDNRYAMIAEEIFAYEMNTMTDKSGAIYSTEDADSEGQEGIFYTWTYEKILEVLGKDSAEIFSKVYNIKKTGNFSSREDYHQEQNIIHLQKNPSEFSQELSMDSNKLEEQLRDSRKKLMDERSQRIRPGLDDKVVTSWNALMISAYARGFQILKKPKYLEAATKAALFIEKELLTNEGNLLRTHRKGQSKFFAYLEDYAYTIRAFVDLYEAGFDESWLFLAEKLAETMISQFWDDSFFGFFNTGHLHKDLIVRTKSASDSALPSPTAVATEMLLRLSRLLDKDDYYLKSKQTLQANTTQMKSFPQVYLSLILAADLFLTPLKEIVIVGKRNSKDTQKLLQAIHSMYSPHHVVAFLDPTADHKQDLIKKIRLLAGRTLIEGKAAGYVCENFTCQLPVTSADDLVEQIKKKSKLK
ncbi:MAG: thioredoxin domain-containing protein [Candidatus Aminicenantes bacterium]|nr:thioredoxin domain-containing protein [Candidatus Aminicenantes bacterium]